MKRAVIIGLYTFALASAGVIRVPLDQPTIQAGLAVAQAGDTVLVAPGTYPERLTWPARDGITLLSETGADSTIIDAGRTGRVITMNAMSYTPATVVRGFRITGGQVTGNGAGIWCTGSPSFLWNQVVDNLAIQGTTGGGIYAEGAPLFAFNLIARDTLSVKNAGGSRYGGGVYCTGSGIFHQNEFSYNAVVDSACSGYRSGGALSLAGGAPLVFCNLILRNGARMFDGSGFAYGGGICVESGTTAYVANNTFVANVCAAHITYGGAIYAPHVTAVIKNNIAILDSCYGSAYGGGIAGTDTLDLVDYNDCWQNYPNEYYGCTPGPHAVSADPLFTSGSLGPWCLEQLASGGTTDSPCLDAGDTLLATVPLYLDSLLHAWTTRLDSVPDAGTIDLGFHYTFSPPTAVESARLPGFPPAALRIEPTPACGTVVRVVGVSGRELRVYDASGRVVLKERLAAGSCALNVGVLRSGVYLVRAAASDEIGRLVIQR